MGPISSHPPVKSQMLLCKEMIAAGERQKKEEIISSFLLCCCCLHPTSCDVSHVFTNLLHCDYFAGALVNNAFGEAVAGPQRLAQFFWDLSK